MFGFKPGGPTLCELIRQGLSSTREGYDLLASKFDLTPFLSKGDVLKSAVRNLRMENRNYNTALDLCTGTGAGAIALATTVRRKVVGVDRSAPMLAEAREKWENIYALCPELPEVTFLKEDILELRYREVFDLVTCFGAFGHFDQNDRRAFLNVAHTALKPGGQFVIDAFEFRLYSPQFWAILGFDAAMRVRNFLWRPRFIMYYLNWLLPRMKPLLDKKHWSSVRVFPVKIKNKPSPFRLLIATKR